MTKSTVIILLVAFGMTACMPEKPEAAIHTAAKSGKAEQIRRILKQHPELVNHKNPGKNDRSRTPLHEASNGAVIKVLLAHGADARAPDDLNWTPLHTAADGDIVDLLVAAGADVRATAQRKLTPLHTIENSDAATALLRHGADIEAVASRNITPLMWQIESSHDPRIIAALLAHHADVNVKSSLDRTLLHLAGSRSNAQTVRLLLEKGLDVNARDEINATPLHYAAQKGYVNVAKILLSHGADPSIRLSDEAVVTSFTGSALPRQKSIAGLTALELAESDEMQSLLRSAQ